jgi:hypothetical protein
MRSWPSRDGRVRDQWICFSPQHSPGSSHLLPLPRARESVQVPTCRDWVNDSEPEAEFQETVNMSKAMLKAVALAEMLANAR